MDFISAYDAKLSSVSGTLITTISGKLAKANKVDLVGDFIQEIINAFKELKIFVSNSNLIQNSNIEISHEKTPSIKDEPILRNELPKNNNNVPNLGYPYLNTSQNDEENPNLKFPKFYKCDNNNCNKIFNNLTDKLNHQCSYDISNVKKDDEIVESNSNIVPIPHPSLQVILYLVLRFGVNFFYFFLFSRMMRDFYQILVIRHTINLMIILKIKTIQMK
jgi:hypothetical protein